MRPLNRENLRSASTARTYPVEAKRLVHATEEAVQSLPRWTLAHADESEVRAVRKTRVFGFEDDVTVRLTPAGSSGASTNTWAEFEIVARLGAWALGKNRRNLKELLAAIERQLRAENY
jgi:uncharacterized protein (DUF1499 family)